MKIIGFSQLHNEREKGNLENWVKCMNLICDKIYVYDQNSTDNSKEIYERERLEVIYSNINDFSREIACKKTLLDKLLKENPDVDWIFWMDGDTILEKNGLNRKNLESFLAQMDNQKIDGVRLEHYNLWRSDIHYRIDNEYHSLNNFGVLAFWKNNGRLEFPADAGLHLKQYPDGMSRTIKSNLKLIHRGFATDYQILNKYKTYKKRGQAGWALDRLLCEKTLTVKELDSSFLPDWFKIKDQESPFSKQKVRELLK